MTFLEWTIKHKEDRGTILEKLKDKTVDEVAEYFNYENMVEAELSFCPLYATKTKCHNIDNLNCFLCACPFFEYSDTVPITIKDGIEVMSICNINSKEANTYIVGNKQQCDCSNCTIPHKQHNVVNTLKGLLR